MLEGTNLQNVSISGTDYSEGLTHKSEKKRVKEDKPSKPKKRKMAQPKKPKKAKKDTVDGTATNTGGNQLQTQAQNMAFPQGLVQYPLGPDGTHGMPGMPGSYYTVNQNVPTNFMQQQQQASQQSAQMPSSQVSVDLAYYIRSTLGQLNRIMAMLDNPTRKTISDSLARLAVTKMKMSSKSKASKKLQRNQDVDQNLIDRSVCQLLYNTREYPTA